ncbi:hypothetical protein AVEN_158601-1 [Araneus ventricosus]|uniref:RNase H type-1 domain-containing protein n=1 Tax=Araneus ventricosus TaxID=182803 RepID=A0A4Y2JL22_ARAVE|nr:hypothetical protein AVEN_158601-1 [Araneus ventricosus]
MELILVSAGRLKRDCSWEGTNFSSEDYEHTQPPPQIHTADFNFKNRISIEGQPLTSPSERYTDDSKLDGVTGCAFCIFEGSNQKFQWMAKLQSFNSVFQTEIFAVNKAIEWANTTKIQASILGDSQSGLKAPSSFKSKTKLIQETQMALLSNPSLNIGWVKSHVGVHGNETADNLAKQATIKGEIHYLSERKSHRKNVLHRVSINK